MRKYDQFLRGNQVITGVEDCNYTDLKNCDVKMWCNFIEEKIRHIPKIISNSIKYVI